MCILQNILNYSALFAERQENGQRWVLQIRNFGPRQIGIYCAVAKSRSGTCSRSWNLHLDLASTEEVSPINSPQIEVFIGFLQASVLILLQAADFSAR